MWRFEYDRLTLRDDELLEALQKAGLDGWDARYLRFDETRGRWDVIWRRVVTDVAQGRRALTLAQPPTDAVG
jgi:hypothetical protein